MTDPVGKFQPRQPRPATLREVIEDELGRPAVRRAGRRALLSFETAVRIERALGIPLDRFLRVSRRAKVTSAASQPIGSTSPPPDPSCTRRDQRDETR